MENNGKKDKPEFGKERLKFAIAQLSFSILALFWIDNYIDTHAISNMWASAILEVGFMMLGWSSIFMFFYITVEGYSLVSPNAKIQKAALSFYKYSFSFSFLLLFVVVLTVGYAKFIGWLRLFFGFPKLSG